MLMTRAPGGGGSRRPDRRARGNGPRTAAGRVRGALWDQDQLLRRLAPVRSPACHAQITRTAALAHLPRVYPSVQRPAVASSCDRVGVGGTARVCVCAYGEWAHRYLERITTDQAPALVAQLETAANARDQVWAATRLWTPPARARLLTLFIVPTSPHSFSRPDHLAGQAAAPLYAGGNQALFVRTRPPPPSPAPLTCGAVGAHSPSQRSRSRLAQGLGSCTLRCSRTRTPVAAPERLALADDLLAQYRLGLSMGAPRCRTFRPVGARPDPGRVERAR